MPGNRAAVPHQADIREGDPEFDTAMNYGSTPGSYVNALYSIRLDAAAIDLKLRRLLLPIKRSYLIKAAESENRKLVPLDTRDALQKMHRSQLKRQYFLIEFSWR